MMTTLSVMLEQSSHLNRLNVSYSYINIEMKIHTYMTANIKNKMKLNTLTDSIITILLRIAVEFFFKLRSFFLYFNSRKYFPHLSVLFAK